MSQHSNKKTERPGESAPEAWIGSKLASPDPDLLAMTQTCSVPGLISFRLLGRSDFGRSVKKLSYFMDAA